VNPAVVQAKYENAPKDDINQSHRGQPPAPAP